MSLRRHLRGYDKWTEALRSQYDVPEGLLPIARQLIGETPDDPDLLDPHPLGQDQVRTLARQLGIPIDPQQYDYYLEADEESRKVAQMRDALLRT